MSLFKDFHIEDIKGADYCGSCHGLNILDNTGKPVCCNSCSSVFAAHEHLGVPPPPMEDIEQCRLENWPDLIKNHADEGCRISGTLNTNKVNGNFHFAPGKSLNIKGEHLHDVRMLDGLTLDFAHQIHSLSFGRLHSHLKNPLDGEVTSPSYKGWTFWSILGFISRRSGPFLLCQGGCNKIQISKWRCSWYESILCY